MKTPFNILLAIFATALLAACGSKSSSQNPAGAEAAPAPSVLTQSSAVGLWKSECFPHEKNSVIASLEFTDAGMTYSETIFHREDCQADAEIVVYAYAYENPVSDATDLEGYQTVKLNVKSATVTLKNPSLVNIFNRDENYGRADWELNKANEITGRAHSKRYAAVRKAGEEVAYTYRVNGEALSLADYKLQAKDKTYKAVASELAKHNFKRVK